jgi:hypothetical protein
MIVVQVGVKTECVKFMVATPYKKHTHRSHTRVKLGAKHFNIFRIACKTTQYFWIQS